MSEAVVSAAVSVVTNLEPIAGISLALNLAYLGLQRWRYRQQVREAADKEYATFGGNPAIIEPLEQWTQLQVLAGHSDKRNSLPSRLRVFEAIYGIENDVKAAFVFAVFAVFILLLGVAHNIGIWQPLTAIATKAWTTFYFYVLAFSIGLPLASVMLGRRLVNTACAHAKACTKQLSAVVATHVQALEKPISPLPQNSPASNDQLSPVQRARHEAIRRAMQARQRSNENPRD